MLRITNLNDQSPRDLAIYSQPFFQYFTTSGKILVQKSLHFYSTKQNNGEISSEHCKVRSWNNNSLKSIFKFVKRTKETNMLFPAFGSNNIFGEIAIF